MPDVKTQKQEKAYPLRISRDLRDVFEIKAKSNKRSLNAEIVTALEQSLETQSNEPSNRLVKVVPLEREDYKRVVYGKLLNELDLDLTQELKLIKSDIALALDVLRRSPKLSLKFAFMTKDIRIHEGGNHLDIIDNGVGSLNWLSVEDHFVGE